MIDESFWSNLVPDAIGAPRWIVAMAVTISLLLLLAVVWAYWIGFAHRWVRLASGLLKVLTVLLIAFCLVEPLRSGVRPRPGANIFGILVDNSRSMRLKDPADRREGHEQLASTLAKTSSWRVRLEQDFDVRGYAFDQRTRVVSDYAELDFQGSASSMVTALQTLRSRFGGRPVGGVLLFSDGNATDLPDAPTDWSKLGIPIYPVVTRTAVKLQDVCLRKVTVAQSNFETAPVTLNAEATCQGFDGRAIVARVLDENDKVIEEQTSTATGKPARLEFRFRFRPETIGVSFYRVQVFPKSDRDRFARGQTRSEVTLANNTQVVAVDRGGGPFRVLYLAGRPNWEFKFLRRSLQEDEELHLVGILRIAHKEAKF